MNKFVISLACASLALAAAIPGSAVQDSPVKATAAHDDSAADKEKMVIADQLPSYPLNKCVVSHEELGSMGEPIDLVVEGHLLRLCCKGCVKKAKANPAAAIKQVEAAVIAKQLPHYPLKKCAVTGKALDPEKEPVNVVVGTRLVRVCCDRCAKKVRADSSKAIKAVNAALIETQKKHYPIKTCIVSGEAIVGEDVDPPVDMLYGTSLVRLCCKRCKKAFHKSPAKYMEKLHQERAKHSKK